MEQSKEETLRVVPPSEPSSGRPRPLSRTGTTQDGDQQPQDLTIQNIHAVIEQRVAEVLEQKIASGDVAEAIERSVAQHAERFLATCGATRDIFSEVKPASIEASPAASPQPQESSLEERLQTMQERSRVDIQNYVLTQHTVVEDRLGEKLQRLQDQLTHLEVAQAHRSLPWSKPGSAGTVSVLQDGLEATWPVPLEYAATSSRPFSARHEAMSTAQHKARWRSDDYINLSASAFTHRGLEKELVSKIMTAQPDRRAMGFSEVVVRDMANSVVRELVGVFESLLDRLLVEKKQDTIRTLVAELMTEDAASTIATGWELLKKQELGHVLKEIESMRVEARESETSWETRFQVTGELQKSLDELRKSTEDRFTAVEARLEEAESSMLPRAELGDHLKPIFDDVETLRQHLGQSDLQTEELARQLVAEQAFSREKFAATGDLLAVEERFTNEVAECRSELKHSFAELLTHAASAGDVDELRTSHAEKLRLLQCDTSEMKRDIAQCESSVDELRQESQATYTTKSDFKEEVQRINEEHATSHETLRLGLVRLEANAATKQAVEQSSATMRSAMTTLQQTLGTTVAGVDKSAVGLRTLEERIDTKLATKEYAYEVAKRLAHQAATESDDREAIAQLRREFEEDRERLRQMVRQHQHSRADLNGTMDLVVQLQHKSDELGGHCSILQENFHGLNGREKEHYELSRNAVNEHKQSHDDLRKLHTRLREEFLSHVEMYKSEGDQMRRHSTNRFLEQMDKALGLAKSLEKVEQEHRDLDATVRNIKLPKV
mmetsp:Transcript_27439/g.60009  ORF Transcript_27439/g.60009 Transcript_27439/m.60009 type:complete len:781 (+) Transcript_27439:96-2438(+)